MKRTLAPLIAVLVVLGVLVGVARSLLDQTPNPGHTTVVPKPPVPNEAPRNEPATAANATSLANPTREREVIDVPSVAPTSEIATEDGPPGSICGRIVNPANEPVPAVEVELCTGPAAGLNLATLRTPTGLIVETDAKGEYKFEKVGPANDYLIIASHPEFGDCEAGPIAVASGENKRVGDIYLQEGTHVQGTVTSNGRPVPEATVTLSNVMDRLRKLKPGRPNEPAPDVEPLKQRTFTNREGHYEFKSVPINSFEITAEAEHLASITKTSQSFLGNTRDHTIDFELTEAVSISGRVVGEQKKGIAGAKVTATIASQAFHCEVEALSNETGSFTIDHLAQGMYFLSAECDGYSSANRAQVEAGSTDVELELRVQGVVSGVVVDEETGAPLTDFELAVLQSFKSRGPERSPVPKKQHLKFHDASGRFEIKNLDPGTYAVQGSAAGYADSTSDEFNVERGQTTASVRVAMNRGGSVTGFVVDRKGRPIAKAQVLLRDNKSRDNPATKLFRGLAGGEPEMRSVTDAAGSFRFDLIVPGTYQIAVRHKQYANTDVDDVEITKGEVKAAGRIEMLQGGRVSGHAFDLDGKALQNATIVASTKTGLYFDTLTNDEGSYDFPNLPAGDYNVTIGNYAAPTNMLQKLVFAKNSLQRAVVNEGDDLVVDLRLSKQKPKE